MEIVRIGQVWVDNDPRLSYQRSLKNVGFIEDGRRAVCEVLNAGRGYPKQVKISVKRFKATSNGYRLKSPGPKG